MVDRPPPSRFSVVERGGRLVVIDRETGRTPPTAAERMDLHDRKMGGEPMRPVARQASPAPVPTAVEAPTVREAPQPPNERLAVAVADMNRKRPWNGAAKNAPRPPGERARIAQRSQPAPSSPTGAGRKTLVTGKWWDAKGPRTIELGPQGQNALTGGFLFLFFGMVIAAIVALFIAPVLFFAGAFLLFRFGGKVLGPIGAGIVDKALAKKG